MTLELGPLTRAWRPRPRPARPAIGGAGFVSLLLRRCQPLIGLGAGGGESGARPWGRGLEPACAGEGPSRAVPRPCARPSPAPGGARVAVSLAPPSSHPGGLSWAPKYMTGGVRRVDAESSRRPFKAPVALGATCAAGPIQRGLGRTGLAGAHLPLFREEDVRYCP